MHSAQKIEKKNRVFAKSVSSQKCTFLRILELAL